MDELHETRFGEEGTLKKSLKFTKIFIKVKKRLFNWKGKSYNVTSAPGRTGRASLAAARQKRKERLTK
ncbi:MAG: hypothetical protein HFE44_05235 [Oscillospiraceae bacterium]|jgi:hypothetical protein|nr:hypothetical protein [Oscillospiraceae bacterium]